MRGCPLLGFGVLEWVLSSFAYRCITLTGTLQSFATTLSTRNSSKVSPFGVGILTI